VRLILPALAATALLLISGPGLAQDQRPANNPEMAEMLAADQAVRHSMTAEKLRDRAFLQTMIAEDAERRRRTRALLEAGSLQTAEDYRAAAFVFQHGATPEDYLLAHSLAVAALAKGDDESAWIAAATLDRYLQMTGKAQIYGTQTRKAPDGPATLDPYDRDLVPDTLRTALAVPTRAEQDERLAALNAATIASTGDASGPGGS
jgi:hypothetical protein